MTLPLMPKATAVWLIEKTRLTFTQIAEFCGLHELEVQGIADGDVASGMLGYDPIDNNQLTKEEITRCENDSNAQLKLISSNISFETKIVPITDCSASILFGSSSKLFLTMFNLLLIIFKKLY